MIGAFPDEVLHRDRDMTQGAHHTISSPMSPQRAVSPSIHCQSRRPFQLAHHSMIDGPVRPPHQREAVLKFLYPPSSLMLLFQMQLTLEVWPRMLQIQLMWRHETGGCSDPIVHVYSLPSHVHQVGLQSCHGSCYNHPWIGCRGQPLPGYAPCSFQIPKLCRRPCFEQLVHSLQLSFDNGVLGILKLGMLVEDDVHTATLLQPPMPCQLLTEDTHPLGRKPLCFQAIACRCMD